MSREKEKNTMNKIIENNRVAVSGEVVSSFDFSHEVFGEKFYTTKLAVERSSGVKDTIPVMASDRLIKIEDMTGKKVKVSGQFRSYNKHEGDKNRLLLSVFAREFEILEDLPFTDDVNEIFLDGYICKKPNCRETPLGREICDIMLAVNRPYGKSDYIPCLAWGRNAVFAGDLEVGTRLRIEGRIQSREYKKKLSDTEIETRTAYEISASRLTVVEEMEE